MVLLALRPAMAEDAPDPSCFARALPAEVRDYRLDDVKRLTGWVFDIAAAHRTPAPGDEIDHHSSLSEASVPGFGGITDLGALRGRYRVMRPPFDQGHGYYGIELGGLDDQGAVSQIYLINRLFRLPILFHDPAGVATDVVTVGAMLTGARTEALADLEAAAEAAYADARGAQVPLLTVGQSQAGGEAQLAAAYLVATHPRRSVMIGFVSLNGARANAAIRRLGLSTAQVQGISFLKDLDPGMGPHGVMRDALGLRVHIHPDGSGGPEAGDQTFFDALVHPSEHLLDRFMDVSLADALKNTLDGRASCDGVASAP